MPEAAGNVGGGLAAVVEADRGAMVDKRLDRRFDVITPRRRVVARRPHQRREAVIVAAVDANPRLKQQRYDRRVSAAGGVDDRALAIVVERVGIGAVLEQPFDAVR